MSYFLRPLRGFGDGEADCDATPDDPVCQAFYAKPTTSAPDTSGNIFGQMLDKAKELIATTPSSASAPTTKKASILPLVLVGGAAVGLYFLVRKKK